jgi:zinc protease
MNEAGISARVQDLVLPNGAKIYLIENHADVTVDLLGLFEGGLFLEPPEQAGLANLTLAMLDRGTRHRTENEISDAIESNGLQLEYALLRECGGVRARCLSEDLPLLLELLGETLTEPTFPEEQLALVREQVLVDLEQIAYETFEQAARRAATRLFHDGHPYAREALGEADRLVKLTTNDLESYRLRALTGPRMSLVVAGHIDPAETAALITRHLGALPREAGEPTAPQWQIGPAGQAAPRGRPEQAANAAGPPAARREHVPIADKEQVDIVFMRPGIARTEPDFEAYGLANFIFGGSFVSRLNQRLRDRAGLTYGAHSAIISGRFPGYWLASTGVPPQQVERAVALVIEELTRFVEEGVSAEELAVAQDHLTGAFPIRLETNQALAALFLDGIRYGRGRDYLERYPERLRAVTRDAVNAAARCLIDPRDFIVVSAGSGNGS